MQDDAPIHSRTLHPHIQMPKQADERTSHSSARNIPEIRRWSDENQANPRGNLRLPLGARNEGPITLESDEIAV